MNHRPLLLLFAALQYNGAFANDFTIDNLTINASATVSGASTFGSWSTFQAGAQFDGPAYFNSNINVTGNAAFAYTTSFGTLYTGLQSSPTPTGRAFTVSVSQGFQEVQVPYTIAGYYQDSFITVEDYGLVSNSHWEAQYTWGIVSGQSYGPYYDQDGNITTPEYNDYQYGYIYTGDVWVDSSYWGVIGSHTEPGQVWVDEQQATYTDYQFGVPKIQFTAARSDANWAWQVPGPEGSLKDIMLLWDGGLRIPSSDSNRMMALMSDSLTQSYQRPWDGTQASVESSEVKSGGIKVVSVILHDTAANGWSEERKAQMQSGSLQISHEEKTGGNSTVVQTQIAADNASFGGVVQVAGDLRVQGVIRVRPSGDLSMGTFINGPQP